MPVLILAVVILLALPSLRDASHDDATTEITVDVLIAAAVYLGIGVTVLILLARPSSLRYFDTP